MGNLSTYAGDNVNIAELVLIKLVHILKVNMKTYRHVRNTILDKKGLKSRSKHQYTRRSSNGHDDGTTTNSNSGDDAMNNHVDGASIGKKLEPVTEIEIAKEYLVQGKLHKAITFGMDVPGLLFGDMKGEECPLPKDYQDHPVDGHDTNNNINNENQGKTVPMSIPDQMLKQRLFGNSSRMIYECELDYNRVLSFRIAQILLSRPDFTSPVLKSAVVEMLSSCVLTPMMGCASPEYINYFILTNLSTIKGETNSQSESSTLKSSIHEETAEQLFQDDDDDDEEHENINVNLTELDDEVSLEDEMINDVMTEIDTSVMGTGTHDSIDIVMSHSGEISYMDQSDEMIALLSMSLMEIGQYVDFEDARLAKESGVDLVDWNDRGCKEVIRNLVLVIESILIHGLLQTHSHIETNTENNNNHNEETEVQDMHGFDTSNTEYTSLLNLLIEVTSDVESFENKMRLQSLESIDDLKFPSNDYSELDHIPKPKMDDLSTLRSLISAWLHTGLVHRTLSVLFQYGAGLLAQFYHEDAFILNRDNAAAFVIQLRILDDVDVIVDTAAVLSCPPLDLFRVDKLVAGGRSDFFPPSLPVDNNNTEEPKLRPASSPKTKMKLTKGLQPKMIPDLGRSLKANFANNKKKLTSFVRAGPKNDKITHVYRKGLSLSTINDTSTHIKSRVPLTARQIPSHLNFRRNEVFATSLRNERERRMKSFTQVFNQSRDNIEMICRSHVDSKQHYSQHRDLHNLAKNFFINTNALFLKRESRQDITNTSSESFSNISSSLVLETISPRRKTSVPEDDSSFLLRAQPTPLNVVSIHRDQRSASLSYKKYAGYYDEPIIHPVSKTDRGGRIRRKCFVRYYPNDRTASISFIQHDRRIDYRTKTRTYDCISLIGVDIESRPKEFERHPCFKSARKGTERSAGTLSTTILASTHMDSADFTVLARSGKACDFLYRLSLFEEPAIELTGKNIIIQNATALGCHQADASSLELSDASLSIALCLDSFDEKNNFYVKCDSSNSPLMYLKIVNNEISGDEKKNTAIFKPFKCSFVRAALLVASSRKDAQLQVSQAVIHCLTRISSHQYCLTISSFYFLFHNPHKVLTFLYSYWISKKGNKS